MGQADLGFPGAGIRADTPESSHLHRSKRKILVCFSHLRWNFVYQRPQHLLSRAAAGQDVYVFEEPVWGGDADPFLEVRAEPCGVTVLTPRVRDWTSIEDAVAAQRRMLDDLLAPLAGAELTFWYYTPMALAFSGHVVADITVYDCMDELSAFRFAPPELITREAALLARADLVFTGGRSLYEAKKDRHRSVHCFPSSIDKAHFGAAREPDRVDPPDQAAIPHPRLGFFGVLDERLDRDLLAELADLRPDWHLVLIGPTAKIDPSELPQRPNIHWLGPKAYSELPAYLAGWDAGFMPFARNDSTRFISPTKTPEFLAAGLPVISTPIRDVIADYGERGLVAIADDAATIAAAAERLLAGPEPGWLARVDAALADASWDRTWAEMSALMEAARRRRAQPRASAPLRLAPIRAPEFDWLVVGAGFAGSVVAERLARGRGETVLLIDRRDHIGGNAYDRLDEAGVLIHQYGPHIFHTNSDAVFEYLSRFTDWRAYEHRVRAHVGGRLLPIPINRDTLNQLYGANLTTEAEAEAFLAARAEPIETIRTAEDVVLARVGRDLYETFFRGYTRKQWGVDPSALDKAVTARVPTRTSTDDRYFEDRHQAMPREGYTRMFERMLDHPDITVLTGRDFRDIRDRVRYRRLVYTGPIDEFFDHRFGKLPYRSLRFEHVTLPERQHQPVAVVNYPGTEPYTRITEYKHLTGQIHPGTSLTYEYPAAEGEPYYPVPNPANQERYKAYERLALDTPDVFFCGRLATYRYYNMDQVVGQALALYRRIEDHCPKARDAAASPVGPRAASADLPQPAAIVPGE